MTVVAPPAGLHHVAIQVCDLSAMERFYGNLLGLPVLRRWPAADGTGERSVWMDLGAGAFLALEAVGAGFERRAEEAPGLHLIALRVLPSARKEWETRLAGAGVAIIHRTDYTLYLRDPEGNRVGLSHWPDPAAG